jgi:hypothetical protein
MKNLIILMVLFFMGVIPLRADQTDSDDKEFSSLDNVNNPFNVQPSKPVEAPVVVPVKAPEPVVAPQPVKVEEPLAPVLKLEGVVVGEEIRQAIINGQVVSVDDTIEGAKVVSVTIDGVGLVFNDKKMFLRVN